MLADKSYSNLARALNSVSSLVKLSNNNNNNVACLLLLAAIVVLHRQQKQRSQII